MSTSFSLHQTVFKEAWCLFLAGKPRTWLHRCTLELPEGRCLRPQHRTLESGGELERNPGLGLLRRRNWCSEHSEPLGPPRETRGFWEHREQACCKLFSAFICWAEPCQVLSPVNVAAFSTKDHAELKPQMWSLFYQGVPRLFFIFLALDLAHGRVFTCWWTLLLLPSFPCGMVGRCASRLWRCGFRWRKPGHRSTGWLLGAESQPQPVARKPYIYDSIFTKGFQVSFWDSPLNDDLVWKSQGVEYLKPVLFLKNPDVYTVSISRGITFSFHFLT